MLSSRCVVVVVVVGLCLVAAAGAARKRASKNDGKIVGGVETDISSVPYQVSLQYYNRHICGGSVISARHILTAAHCVNGLNARLLSVRVGSSLHSSGGEVYRVWKATMHPDYDRGTSNNDIAVLELDAAIRPHTGAKIMPWKNKYRGKHFNNDIAVLELEREMKLGNDVKVISLAGSEPRAGDEILVSGWGSTLEGGAPSRTLRSVTVPTITRESCQRQYMRYNTVTDKMFCGGYREGGRDACQGDSGGPAVVDYRLAGVVSWGAGCARRNAPGVYANVAKFTSWILDNSQAKVARLRSPRTSRRTPT